ncbi:MAG: PQQ-binding-like beta-propeller repeat protein [Chloroflexi bacterium]|jgi:sugar lactone lactonase YvrE|nr:PQQ-binding-like beta-propeller repeat protein [Chloroflexota bacterium]
MKTIATEQHHLSSHNTPLGLSLRVLVSTVILGLVAGSIFAGCGESTREQFERGTTITEGPVSEAWNHDYSRGKWLESNAITVDEAGFIYATGDDATVKYDSEGTKLWESREDGFTGNDIVADKQGNIYVNGTVNGDYITIKYDSEGDVVWERRYDGWSKQYNGPDHQGTDESFAIIVDELGNSYVTGRSKDIDGERYDRVTIKYDNYGNDLWVDRYEFPPDAECFHYSSHGICIAIDRSGNVIAAGSGETQICSEYKYSEQGKVSFYLTTKYDSEGNELWSRRYQYKGTGYRARAVVSDDQGSIYVSGEAGTVKYSSEGDMLWDVPMGGRAFACDAEGNIYVGDPAEDDDESVGYIAKYDTNGNQLWSVPFSPEPLPSSPLAIALDEAGNVYAAGWYRTVVKYDSQGREIWSSFSKHEDENITDGSFVDIAMDSTGNVYATGRRLYKITNEPRLNVVGGDDIYYYACFVAKFVQLPE